jgi:hypothetical protein
MSQSVTIKLCIEHSNNVTVSDKLCPTNTKALNFFLSLKTLSDWMHLMKAASLWEIGISYGIWSIWKEVNLICHFGLSGRALSRVQFMQLWRIYLSQWKRGCYMCLPVCVVCTSSCLCTLYCQLSVYFVLSAVCVLCTVSCLCTLYCQLSVLCTASYLCILYCQLPVYFVLSASWLLVLSAVSVFDTDSRLRILYCQLSEHFVLSAVSVLSTLR